MITTLVLFAMLSHAERIVVHVAPGELHRCADIAHSISGKDSKSSSSSSSVRCELSEGIYRDDIELSSVGVPVEIVGAGMGATVMEGSVPVANVKWVPWTNPLKNNRLCPSLPFPSLVYIYNIPRYTDSILNLQPSPLAYIGPLLLTQSNRLIHSPRSHIFKATLPAALQIKNIQQAFVDGSWISEARYPDTDLAKVLKETSWGFCGKGSAHGYEKETGVVLSHGVQFPFFLFFPPFFLERCCMVLMLAGGRC